MRRDKHPNCGGKMKPIAGSDNVVRLVCNRCGWPKPIYKRRKKA